MVFKLAIDDEDDEVWSYEKTEDDAIMRVDNETEEYGNDEEFQFRYEELT